MTVVSAGEREDVFFRWKESVGAAALYLAPPVLRVNT